MKLCVFLFVLFLSFPARAFPMGGEESSASLPVLAGTNAGEAEGYTNQIKTCHDEGACPDAVMGEHRTLMKTMNYVCRKPRFMWCNWWIREGDEACNSNSVKVKMSYEKIGAEASIPLYFDGSRVKELGVCDCAISDVSPLLLSILEHTSGYNRMGIEVPDVLSGYHGGNSTYSTNVFSARTLEDSQVDNVGALELNYHDVSGGTYNGYGSSPIAVLCELKEGAQSGAIIGDSIENGNGAATRGLNEAGIPNTNLSRNFMALSSTLGIYRTSMLAYHTFVIFALGTNNIGFTSVEDLKTYSLNNWAAAKAQGLDVYQATIPPRSDYNHGCSTSDQLPYNEGYVNGGARDILNEFYYQKAADGTINGVIERSTPLEDPTDHTKWNTEGALLSEDCTHLTESGKEVDKIVFYNFAKSLVQAPEDVN